MLHRRLAALQTDWQREWQEITAKLQVSLFNKHLCKKKTKITKTFVLDEIRKLGLPKKITGAVA
jgi:hypothetical protein